MWSKTIETFDPWEALLERNQKGSAVKFKSAVRRLRHSRWKLFKHYVKTLKFCWYHINRIGYPVTESEKETLEKLLSLYDDAIVGIKKDADKIRMHMEAVKGETNEDLG